MKQMNFSNAKQLLLLLVAGAMTMPLFTACSSHDDLTQEETKGEARGTKFIINATLPDDKGTRCGTLVDNDTHTGGMRFKWTESKKKIAALAILRGTDHYDFTRWWDEDYQLLAVTPDENNDKKATLTAYTELLTEQEGSFYCMQNASDISVSFEDNKATANLIMPEGNLFVQTERNGLSHLSDYLFVKGYGSFDAPEYNEAFGSGRVFVQWVNIPFHTSVATIRLKVTNKLDEDVTLKSISIQAAGSEKIFPDKKAWNLNCGTLDGEQLNEVKETIDEPSDKNGYTSSVTAQYGTEGFSVAKGEAIYNYMAVHQHDNVDALAGKMLEIVVETTDGTRYTTYNFDCDNLSQITGNKDFVANYTYTFTLSLKDNRLQLGGVTLNEWGVEKGGEAEESPLSLTAWCMDDTFKEQREALTTLTLDAKKITQAEVDNYTQGNADRTVDNFKTYFPYVTTVKLTDSYMTATKLLRYNQTVNTIIGETILSLPDHALEANSAVTCYEFPILESVGEWCFNTNHVLESISLPRLKTIGQSAFAYMRSLKQVCFASINDFSGTFDIFKYSDVITDLALGTTEQMIFPEDKTNKPVKSVLGGPMSKGNASNTTLYLNEEGYEYQHADLVNNIWQGITFKAIRKYSEYTGKKD